MGYEKEGERDGARTNVCVVEATDEHGRLIGREAFPTQQEGDAHAAAMRAKGYRVEQSSLEPKSSEKLGDV